MKSLNPSPESGRRNGVIGLGLVPGHGPPTVNIKVSHGLNHYEVAVPSNSSFGYLKSIISQKIGLKPEMHKLFFRGEEKQDAENLQTAGVMNNSEVLLMEDMTREQKIPEEETNVISKGDEAVAEVRKEVDKLTQQVSVLEGVVDGGTKVDEKEIIYLSEMLMRQLLKLDGIEAEGEGRVQRRMEVRRIQGILEKLDVLKSRNSNPLSNTQKTTSVTTQREACNASCESTRSVTTQWETFDPVNENVNPSFPIPPSSQYPTPYFAPPNVPSSTSSTEPYYVPSHNPYFIPPNVPYYVPSSQLHYYVPSSQPYYVPSPGPYFIPSDGHYYVPSTASSSSSPSSVPFPMPSSSTNVTQNWEHFG
ncbi:hypothetical protein CDL12_16111 [Handroanthus impetiginosus]|uniref:BCL2-associated athanogene-like protein n=1 Tax=Handroanthus impetiginosus TaxID=429701 RepID=A0A2G9H1A0_9LAMI|nr:hypothetical protein CDL12_16111 [Handroanthus impetiginosus]